MVYISIIQQNHQIILNCHKGSRDGEFFQLIIDSNTRQLIKRPKNADIDASVAYSHVYALLKTNEPLPSETIAAWG